MAVSHLDGGEEEIRSLGWNLVNIHQELDADHLTAAQRPVGHQRFPGIDAAQVGGVAGNAANALLFEISDHVGTRSGPAFGFALKRFQPQASVGRLGSKILVVVPSAKNDHFTRSQVPRRSFIGLNVFDGNFGRSGPVCLLRRTDQRTNIDHPCLATGPFNGDLFGRQRARTASSILLFILFKPATHFRCVSNRFVVGGQCIRWRNQMRSCHGIHQMSVMPHVEVFGVKKVDLQIHLSVIASADARRCQRQLRRQCGR